MADFDQQSLYSEGASSVYDEERIKKLFQACDTNGDGYIDSEDLLTVCRELNLEYSLSELMHELGADETGRISYDEFLRRRLALKPEIEALKSSDQPNSTPDYLPTSSDNSLGGASAGKERWEFDSGARDLSPEPNTLQRLVEAAGGSVTTRNAASLLQLANKLHLAALGSLRREISELSFKLESVSEERDRLKARLKSKESSDTESIIEQYEERLTELHSVIAELNRKMEWQGALVIEEEAQSDAGNSVDISQSEFEFPSPPEEAVSKNQEKNCPPVETTTISDELKALQISNNDLHEQLHTKDEELKSSKAIIESLQEELAELKEKTLNENPDGDEVNSNLAAEYEERYELEIEMLKSRLGRLRTENAVSRVLLDETKEQCENLTLLLGKYESNTTAMRLVLTEAESAICYLAKLTDFLETLVPLNLKGREEEVQLRKEIKKCLEEKDSISSSLLDLRLETFRSYSAPSPEPERHPEVDLEKVVLVQELMKEREQKIEARRRWMGVEKERHLLDKKLRQSEAKHHEILKIIDRHLQEAGEDGACGGQNLRDSLTESLEKHALFAAQMKEANIALVQNLERSKKKYQAKIARLESEIKDIEGDHQNQLVHLRGMIEHLELQLSLLQNPDKGPTLV